MEALRDSGLVHMTPFVPGRFRPDIALNAMAIRGAWPKDGPSGTPQADRPAVGSGFTSPMKVVDGNLLFSDSKTAFGNVRPHT